MVHLDDPIALGTQPPMSETAITQLSAIDATNHKTSYGSRPAR